MTAASSDRVDKRRAEIIAAAISVMKQLGFERMRLRDVAKEAGVSIGLLQHYFETREHLVREAFAVACGERARDFAESAPQGDSGWDRVRQMLDHALDADAVRNRAATWIDLCAAASRNADLRQEAARVQEVWREPLAATIAEAEASGEFTLKLDLDRTVELLLAIVDGTEVAATIATDDYDPASLRATTLQVARDLLGVRSPAHEPLQHAEH